jgi:hypothetical protein
MIWGPSPSPPTDGFLRDRQGAIVPLDKGVARDPITGEGP